MATGHCRICKRASRRESERRKRKATHCKRGDPRTPENLTANGHSRIGQRASNRKYAQRKKREKP
jgi:hypothetical protein